MLSHRLILHALNKCLNLTPPVHKRIYSDHFIRSYLSDGLSLKSKICYLRFGAG